MKYKVLKTTIWHENNRSHSSRSVRRFENNLESDVFDEYQRGQNRL